MAKISYVNGRYVHHAAAFVHMEDRGYQFSDGVYEVIAFFNGRLVDGGAHIARLWQSLAALQIVAPMTEKALNFVMAELIARNAKIDGTLYIQITRGVSRRDHPFPASALPALVMAVTGPKLPKASEIENGVGVITAPDERWARRDIKSVSLLANVLAKQKATAAGVREAWLVTDGMIGEGAVSNNFIVDGHRSIITHPLGHGILGGITRQTVLRLAAMEGISVRERVFSLKEALAASEAFLTSTTANVLPVTRIDGMPVGDGRPGPVTRRLLQCYLHHITATTGKLWN